MARGTARQHPAGPSWPRAWIDALTTERARPDRVRAGPHAWRLAVGTVCFGAFMGQLDASVVTLAYGPLSAEFHAPLAAVQWVSLSYLLTLITLLIPVGRLSDRHGRKLTYLRGFVVFSVASAACGLAPSLLALTGFRVAQAVGAAMLQANSVALAAHSAPAGRVRSALGAQAAAQALGLAVGPTVGGVLVATAGWRWVFGVNVPVGVAAVLAGHFLLPRTRQRTPRASLDLAGVLLLATAATSALLAASTAAGLDLPAWSAPALLVVAAGAGWLFVRRQRAAASPLLDLSLLRDRAVGVGLAAALCGYLTLFGPLVLAPAVLAPAGFAPPLIGLALSALPAGLALAAANAERLTPVTWSGQARCVAGAAVSLAALGALWVAPVTPAGMAAPLFLLGVGLGAFAPANNALIMAAIPARSAAVGGALVSLSRAVGTAFGVAAVTLGLHLAVSRRAAPDPRPAVLILAAVAGLMLACALLAPRRDAPA